MRTVFTSMVLIMGLALAGCPATEPAENKAEEDVKFTGGFPATEEDLRERESSGDSGSVEGASIRFGVLNVLQALPLFVAQEKGYFAETGMEVELVPFESAADKDIALSSGALEGYFGDLFTPITIEGNGTDITIVATNYRSKGDARMFAILASKDSGHKAATDLVNVPVGISDNSVIHYVTEKLLTEDGLDSSTMATLDIKNIGLRMQNLMAGQIPAATLPEPLVSAALGGGCTLIADDKGMEVSQTVLIFSEDYARANGNIVSAFLGAVDKANELIASDPDEVRPIMVANVRLPEPLKDSFPVPKFPAQMELPSIQMITEAVGWLRDKGVFEEELNYTDLVNGDFLP